MEFKKGVYEHYKGKKYRLIDVALNSETLEEMVVYKALYDEEKMWVRPAGMWNEEVEVNDEKVPRFKYIGE